MGKKLPFIVVESVRQGVLYEAETKGCVLYLPAANPQETRGFVAK
jgi:hypothetical protein